ncbi:MAG: pyruvate kinase [Ignavibacteriales bacterium]
MRKTKIVCTLGPATDKPEIVRALVDRGMDVARLNFSHGTHKEHAARMQMVREAARDAGRYVAIMLDTKGPEIRTGKLKNGKALLRNGQQFILTTRKVEGDETQVQVSFAGLHQEVQTGNRVLISDGYIQLEVEDVQDKDIICRVIFGGVLGEKKGINIPGVRTKLPFMSKKDRDDINFGLDNEIDFIAASFVTVSDDVHDIRRLVEERGRTVDIIAKIESQEGVANLDDIIKVADGIMVARGDLGVEIPTEEVPLVQKVVIEKCNTAGKPVIIATQMLESMIYNPRPTRAEASDVANAIFDGADAIMLSGETAAGAFPQEAVETMARIACRTEQVLHYEEILKRKRFLGNISVTDAISYATCATAEDLGASAIISATQSGSTARMVSKYRPRSPIIATTPREAVARRLNLVWGVRPLLVEKSHGTDHMIDESVRATLEAGYIKEGDLVVITAGVPTGVPGTTNLLKVHVVAEVLINGTGIGMGAATGEVRLIRDPEEEGGRFNPGDILVAAATDRDFMGLFEQAGAVITEEGGLTSHAAIVGLNLGIPVVVGATDAMRKLVEGSVVTVDTARGQIYRGATKVL